MSQTPITLTPDLTDLIRIQRTDVARVTQKGAALAAGFKSDVWWRQIENGYVKHAPADSLARMCYSIDVTPEQLRNIGQDEVADLVERRRELLEPEAAPTDIEGEIERHLMITPGLADGQRSVLVTVAFGLLRAEADTGAASIAR
jgi:hypothetical protein